MKRSDSRILTSRGGSILLPPRADHGVPKPPKNDAELLAAVRSVVDKQVEVGLDVVNDGDLCMGLQLLHCMHEVFGGVQHRTREVKRGSPRGVPNADMETFAEYYERHPMLPFDPGLFVCTGPVVAQGVGRLNWSLRTLRGRLRERRSRNCSCASCRSVGFTGGSWMSTTVLV